MVPLLLKLKMLKKMLCRFCHISAFLPRGPAIVPTPKTFCRQHCKPRLHAPAMAVQRVAVSVEQLHLCY